MFKKASKVLLFTPNSNTFVKPLTRLFFGFLTAMLMGLQRNAFGNSFFFKERKKKFQEVSKL